MYRRSSTFLFLLVTLVSVDLFADRPLYNAEGYRIARYRAVLPDLPPAGKIIDTQSLVDLIRKAEPILIDVQAITLRPESQEFGLSWLPSQDRWHIPGSTWLPNVGYGQLDSRMLIYLKSNLQRLTHGDRSLPLVFYCVVDCWMSWNAVKRVDELGYDNLYWYPEGSDGWDEAGLELVLAQPTPLQGIHDGCPPGHETTRFFDCMDSDLRVALVRVHEEPELKGLMLFFETEDCPFCQRMHRGILKDPDLIGYFRKRFIAITLDLESDDLLIAPDGSETTARSYSLEIFGVVRTPTMIFLSADGNEIYRYTGIIVDQRVMRALADYVSGGYYDQIGFREFLSRS